MFICPVMMIFENISHAIKMFQRSLGSPKLDCYYRSFKKVLNTLLVSVMHLHTMRIIYSIAFIIHKRS